jgi:1-pyrroline-5-carboxylate dehydrogenase
VAEQQKVTYAASLSDETMHTRYEEALSRIPALLGKRHPLYIGGRGIFSPTEFEVRSPVDTGILIGSFQNATAEQVHTAIARSSQGFPSWSRAGWHYRSAILRKSAGALDAQKFLLSALITYEIGKTRSEALAEVAEAVDMIRYYCDLYEEHQGYVTPMAAGEPGQNSRSVLKPYGVWAVISPFNFPVSLAAGMAGAALLTGNTVVFKPTSGAPLSGLKLYQAFMKGGVPAGALQFVTGPGKAFGETVVPHPDIAGIAFTGSRDAGTWLHRGFCQVQPYAKPMVTELGSKNPVIVTEHADIAKAVEGVVRSAFGYGGQKCSAASRVYVQTGVMSAFTEALRRRVAELKVGDPREREAFFGPLIDTSAVAKFRAAVTEAERDGGRLVCGGQVLTGGIFDRGFYVSPTVATGLPRTHRLVKDELFVPFIVMDTFSSLDEAIRLANSSEYGLTAGIFSDSEEEIGEFFDAIGSGVCYANRSGGATTGAWPGSQSFGGWKASGSTGKGVGGPYYLLSFVREQAQTRER